MMEASTTIGPVCWQPRPMTPTVTPTCSATGEPWRTCANKILGYSRLGGEKQMPANPTQLAWKQEAERPGVHIPLLRQRETRNWSGSGRQGLEPLFYAAVLYCGACARRVIATGEVRWCTSLSASAI